MNNYTVSNIGFPVGQWIDTSTGEYDKYHVRELLRDLYGCAEDILRMTLRFEEPVFINNGLFPEKLNIKLSEDILYESSGVSLKDIRKMLNDIIKDIPDKRLVVLKEMLDKINGIKELEVGFEIRRYINDIHPENEKVRKLLGQIENKQSLVLGKFIPSKGTDKLGNIILYPKAIAISKRTKASSFDTVFWTTFAHEIFHAYHYGAFVQNGKADRWNDSLNGTESKMVKESLAAAFESKFVFQCESDGSIPHDLSKGLRRELEYEWIDNDLLDWPYSGALGIIREELPAFDFPLFTKLIECSLEDWELPAEAIMAGYYTLKVEHKTGKL
ncbi:MAG: hypothetical protein J5535_05930 [Firmicutes bacterium]|nr:hypothetical protein [Bacillota bacterium]